MRSIPQTAKGHGEIIEVSFFGCDLGILENLRHLSYFLAKVMASVLRVGQKYPYRKTYERMNAPQYGCRRPLYGSPKVCSSLLQGRHTSRVGGKASSIELPII